VTSAFSPSALAGRTVLVTGASGGIGSITAAALGAAGASVVAHHRSGADVVERALADVPAARKRMVLGDLSTPAGARSLWRDTEAIAPLDVLVLNAAVIPDSPMDGPDEEWDAGWTEAMQVNVIGAGALLREAVRTFAARGGGTAIVLSSWAAEQGSRILDATAYAASKAAIRNLAQTFARHYARAGVKIHVVAPGVVSAGMAVSDGNAERIQAVAEGLTAGRLVTPEEVAAVITFLACDACPSLTGATLDINGASYIR
jgi:3-oxoacyl-[acyl-carrier protein] reductase